MRSKLSGVQIPTAAKLNIDGEFTLDSVAGTSGQLLASAGSGNTPTWVSTLTNINGLTSDTSGTTLTISTGARTGANTGNLYLQTGAATTTGNSGFIYMDTGSAVAPTYTNGIIAIGTTPFALGNGNTDAIYIGNSSSTTTMYGTISGAKLNNPLLSSISTVGGGGAEGGQINFARVTDGAAYWYIDSYGGTSTPDFRIIEDVNERFKIAAGGLVTAGAEKVTSSAMVFSQANSSSSTNVTTAVFPAAYDTLSGLAAATLYRFRATYYSSLTYAGFSGTIGISFGFSNAPASIKYSFKTYTQTGASGTIYAGASTTTGTTTIVPTQTSSGTWFTEVSGYFITHATLSSTVMPQFISTATSSTTALMQSGSMFEVEKLGSSTATVIAGSWG